MEGKLFGWDRTPWWAFLLLVGAGAGLMLIGAHFVPHGWNDSGVFGAWTSDNGMGSVGLLVALAGAVGMVRCAWRATYVARTRLLYRPR